MKAKSVSAAFTTNLVPESRDFYVKHLGAQVTFDCGWYVNLQFGGQTESLQFMSPQAPEQQLASGAGLIYNFEVDDVDGQHRRLMAEGLQEVMPLEDHLWGDRGFAVLDPNGISLYFYALREPSPEFQQYYK